MKETKKYDNWMKFLIVSVIVIIVCVFTLTVTNTHLAKGTYSAGTEQCYSCYGSYVLADQDLTVSGCDLVSLNNCQSSNSPTTESAYSCWCFGSDQCQWAEKAPATTWHIDESGEGCYWLPKPTTSTGSATSTGSTTSTGSSDDITCSVSLSCDSTVVKNESVNVTATVTVYKNGTKLTSGGTSYLSNGLWSSGGGGCSGCGNSPASSLYSSITLYANNAVGGTINTNFVATLTNGKTCYGSKTITVVDCNNCTPTTTPTTTPTVTPGTPTSTPPEDSPTSSSTYACYLVNHKYVWASSKPSGGTLVSSITTESKCSGCESSYTPDNNNNCVKPSSNPSSNVPVNPKTGTVGIIVAWVIGLAAIVYSLWYFKKSSSIK